MAATRVAILCHTAQLGGAEIALMRLVGALPSEWDPVVVLFSHGELEEQLQRRGVVVKVVPLAAPTANQDRSGLTNLRVVLRSVRDSLGFTGELARRLEELNIDLVVANSLKAAVLGSVAARRARLPWVWHLHDRLSPDYLPASVVVGMRVLARTARQVVANSRQTADLTRLPPERVTVAYPGLPGSCFSQGHQVGAPPVFGLLGRISSTKGQREFIQAAALVAAIHPTAEFHIVGDVLFNDQAYDDEVRRLPESLGIGDRVHFTGWVSNPAGALDGFTALVHASPVPEPYGQVIVEAMAREVPVIATVGGGVAEILTGSPDSPSIAHGGALRTALGQLVRPRDPSGLASAMTWVLDNPADAAQRGRAAAQSARERFSVSATVSASTAAWRSALGMRGRGQPPAPWPSVPAPVVAATSRSQRRGAVEKGG